MRLLLTCLLLSLFCTANAAAQSGWQTGFGNPGPNFDVSAIGGDASSIYIAGNFTQVGSIAAQGVARWDRAGQYWEAMGAGLPLRDAWELAIDGQGHVYARSSLLSLATWDGTAWQGVPEVQAHDLQAYGGTAFALGTLARADTTFVGLLQATATGWEPYLDSLPPSASLLAISQDGDVYVAGDFFAGTDSAATLAHWGANRWQFLDSVFERDRNLSPRITDLVAQNDTLFVAGSFDRIEGVEAAGLAYWHEGTWQQMGAQPPSASHYLAATASGTLYTNGEPGHVYRWRGQAWDTLAAPTTKDTWTLAAVGDTLFLGMATAVPVSTEGFRVRQEHLLGFDGATWFRLGDDAQGLDATVTATAEYQGRIYASGHFHFAGTQTARIAYWADKRWQPVAADFEKEADIRALCFTNDGTLYVGGNFHLYAEADTISDVARWDGEAWHPLGKGLARTGGDTFDTVDALECSDAAVYVGGLFNEVRNPDGTATPVGYMAKWEAGSWDAVSGGADAPVRALHLEGEVLYVGGTFAQAGGIPAPNIAAYDRNTEQWTKLGEGPGGTVATLTVSDDVVYVGSGPWLPSQPPAYLVRAWDGQTWTDLDPGISMIIQSLATDRHGQVYAGGYLTSISGHTSPELIRWDGDTWHTVEGGVQGSNGGIHTLLVHADRLHVGGAFDTVGDPPVPAAHFAIWSIPENITVEEPPTTPAAEVPLTVFPNPFREQVQLALTLPEDAMVTVRLVDVLGREAVHVAARHWQAGTHRLSLGTEAQSLAAGVYFCVVTIDGQAQTLPLVRLGR